MQTSLLLSIGIVGSVASVIALLIAAPTVKSKFIHLSYGVFITVLAALMFHYQQQLDDTRRAERQAKAILKTGDDRSTTGSMAGFMLASLSFLEKNRQKFPDTYARAEKLCESAACTEYATADASAEYDHFLRMQEASGAMMFLMRGIAESGPDK
jgi:hypothetical protein